ncbi:MAG: hypothetical protein A2139_07855 [Desulfobacca sp. RBG_16_60_12]|nr:MAG: hypothetical protein A2139_07855 [Desulfobacca sp. RBG_16_60_12]
MWLTPHARVRWLQRCSHLDLDTEFDAAKRASKAMINRLRRGWERSQGVGTWPAHYDYLVSPGGAVFIACDGVVITIMRAKDVKQWDNRTVADDRLRRRHAIV